MKILHLIGIFDLEKIRMRPYRDLTGLYRPKKKQYRRVKEMFRGFEKIVEERIREAQMKGDFDNLPGAGKPLEEDNDHHVPGELRLAYRILKNAGCLPPDIELKKEILKTEDLLAGVKEEAEKYRILKKLNLMIMKLNTMRNAPVELEIPQYYVDKITDKFDSRSDE